MSGSEIPGPSVARLATYLHVLRSFGERGALITSSGELASAAGVNPAILRKDLSHIGANGMRGVGYDIDGLTRRLAIALRTDSVHHVALAGASRLGMVLLSHTGFGRGLSISAIFDDDPALIGTTLVPGGPTVAPLGDIEHVCLSSSAAPIGIGVIATSDDDARDAFDAFVAAGVRQVLNVTPVSLSADSDVFVRQVDLALEMQVLAFQASRLPLTGVQQGPSRVGSVPSAGRRPGVMGEETVTA